MLFSFSFIGCLEYQLVDGGNLPWGGGEETVNTTDSAGDSATEQDCDSWVWWADNDGDGYGWVSSDVQHTNGMGSSANFVGYGCGPWDRPAAPSHDDCLDSDATIHPYAEEIIGDGVDQDCNGKDQGREDCASGAVCGYFQVSLWPDVPQEDCDATAAALEAAVANGSVWWEVNGAETLHTITVLYEPLCPCVSAFGVCEIWVRP
jgi:hypothetical protein